MPDADSGQLIGGRLNRIPERDESSSVGATKERLTDPFTLIVPTNQRRFGAFKFALRGNNASLSSEGQGEDGLLFPTTILGFIGRMKELHKFGRPLPERGSFQTLEQPWGL
jgi:hypothetical protein